MTNSAFLCPREELNLCLLVRSELFYPLNYKGVYGIKNTLYHTLLILSMVWVNMIDRCSSEFLYRSSSCEQVPEERYKTDSLLYLVIKNPQMVGIMLQEGGNVSMWTMPDSNRPPLPCHGSALPNELMAQSYLCIIATSQISSIHHIQKSPLFAIMRL